MLLADVTQGCYLIKWHGTLKIICGYFVTDFGWLKVCYFFS